MSEETKVGLDIPFLTSRIGLFKIGTFVLCLLSLIVLAATQFWAVAGLGALHASNFTFSFICITQLISIFVYFCKLYNLPLVQRLPWKLLEMGHALLCALLLFIAMAICAWGAEYHKNFEGNLEASFACCAVFAAILMLGFGAYAFFTYRSDEIRSEPNRGS